MAPAMCGVAVSAGSVQNVELTRLFTMEEIRHSAKGEADPRRLQAARSAVISLGAAAV